MRNQKTLLLQWLLSFDSIHVGEAAAQLGIHCLHKRIAELREDGWLIDSSEVVQFTNRLGNAGSMVKHKLVFPLRSDGYASTKCFALGLDAEYRKWQARYCANQGELNLSA